MLFLCLHCVYMAYLNELQFLIKNSSNSSFPQGSVTVHKSNLWTVHKALDHKHGYTAQMLTYTTFCYFNRTAQMKKETVIHFSFLISLAFILSETRLISETRSLRANHHNRYLRHLHHNRSRKRTITTPSPSSPSSQF
jgi:hypothetical protein